MTLYWFLNSSITLIILMPITRFDLVQNAMLDSALKIALMIVVLIYAWFYGRFSVLSRKRHLYVCSFPFVKSWSISDVEKITVVGKAVEVQVHGQVKSIQFLFGPGPAIQPTLLTDSRLSTVDKK